jgi:periplasmic divalent cation tolerance protein
MNHCSIYITTPDRESAVMIARNLVESRLASCANLLGAITSIYWWDGKVHETGEFAFLAKTTDERVQSLIDRVKSIHPYQVPCIVAWPIAAGHQPYLDWISAETMPQA